MSRDDEIRAREQAATPGPWEVDYNQPFSPDIQGIFKEDYGYVLKAEIPDDDEDEDEDDNQKQKSEDAEFIAHSREDIPYLLDEKARLKAALDEAERSAENWMRDFKNELEYGLKIMDELARWKARAEALEMAIESMAGIGGACAICKHNVGGCCNNDGPCSEDFDLFEFDKARFAGGSKNHG